MVADIKTRTPQPGGIAAEIGGIAQRVDVADGASVAAMAQAARDAWGRIDILVNNRGHHPSAQAEVEEVRKRNSTASSPSTRNPSYLTAREIVPGMKAAGRGAILTSPRPRSVRRGPGWTGT